MTEKGHAAPNIFVSSPHCIGFTRKAPNREHHQSLLKEVDHELIAVSGAIVQYKRVHDLLSKRRQAILRELYPVVYVIQVRYMDVANNLVITDHYGVFSTQEKADPYLRLRFRREDLKVSTAHVIPVDSVYVDVNTLDEPIHPSTAE